MARAALALAAIATVFALALLAVWIGQRRLIYFPSGGPLSHPRDAGLERARVITLTTTDGLRLAGWFVEPVAPSSGWTVVLFNGNGGNRAMRVPLARRLAAHGMAVLMFDYRGYGGNPGTPSEAGLMRDARAARQWLDEHLGQPSRVAYFGESLGTGVAVALAADKAPQALVLRSPFTSLPDVAAYHYPFVPAARLLRDRYPSAERIGRLSCPILIIAAEHDSVVPLALSRQLFEAARPANRQWFMLPGADHNDFETLAGDAILAAVVEFLERAGRS